MKIAIELHSQWYRASSGLMDVVLHHHERAAQCPLISRSSGATLASESGDTEAGGLEKGTRTAPAGVMQQRGKEHGKLYLETQYVVADPERSSESDVSLRDASDREPPSRALLPRPGRPLPPTAGRQRVLRSARDEILTDELIGRLYGRGVEASAWQAASRASQGTSMPCVQEVRGATRPSIALTEHGMSCTMPAHSTT